MYSSSVQLAFKPQVLYGAAASVLAAWLLAVLPPDLCTVTIQTQCSFPLFSPNASLERTRLILLIQYKQVVNVTLLISFLGGWGGLVNTEYNYEILSFFLFFLFFKRFYLTAMKLFFFLSFCCLFECHCIYVREKIKKNTKEERMWCMKRLGWTVLS